MLRFVLFAFAIYIFLNTANAQSHQMSERTREAIFVMQSLCLARSDISIESKGRGGILVLKKGFKVEGEYKETEVISLLQKLQSDVNLLVEADKIRECTKPHIEKILNFILGQGVPEKSSLIIPRDSSDYTELILANDPLEYAKATICDHPNLYKFNYNFLSSPSKIMFFSALSSVSQSASLVKELFKLNPNDIDCSIERICKVFGSVPINIITDNAIYVFETPMRQVRVLAGQCQNKVGFVSERFIDF